jgi:hypothetical protein
MDELTIYLDALKGLAQKMTSMRLSKSPTLNYHTLADAIYWSDEIPRRLSAEEDDALRALLRFRTSLILSEPEERLKCFWEVGKEFFPTWIGFAEERVSANPSVIEFYQQCVNRLDRRLKKVWDKINEEK